MIDKLTYKIETQNNTFYPVFKALVNEKELNYYLIPAGLKYSLNSDGVYPLLNCGCGYVGSGGAYIKVRHD